MAKQQWEIDSKDRFLKFLRDTRGEGWMVVGEDVVVNPSTNRNFDFALGSENKRIALEIFRLVDDEDELARLRVWGEIVNSLQAELGRRNLKGYVLSTPPFFMVSRAKRDAFVDQVANRIERAIADNPDSDEITFDGFFLKRIEGLATISCCAFGHGGAVNPPGIALASLEQKLPTKNEQLNIAGYEKAILITNWSHLVGVDDISEAVSTIDFSRFPNIEKMFFEQTDGTCVQIFDRAVFEGFETGSVSQDATAEFLFVKWLEFSLARKERRGFEIVKKLTTERGTSLWLPAMSRAEVVRYGTEFVKEGDWDNVSWILSNFKDDPDPGIDDGNHSSIAAGESTRFIQTVRGHLCWLLHEIVRVNRYDLYEKAFSIVEQYALGENFYVRQQATAPLAELAKRRLTPSGGEPQIKPPLADHIRALVVHMVYDNAGCPPILEHMVHVVGCTPDLTPPEAEELLRILLNGATDEAARSLSELLIFYGVYRETKGAWLGTFNATNLTFLLEQQAASGSAAVRSSILWRLCQIPNVEVDLANVLPQLLASFALGAYDRTAYFHFYKLIAKAISSRSEILGQVLNNALRQQQDYLTSHEDVRIWDFNRQWEALRCLFESGRADEFVMCIGTLTDFRERIYDFPQDDIRYCLRQVQSDRAQDHIRRLDSKS